MHIRVRAIRFWWFAVAIVAVAAGVRFYQLGAVPHGLAWDEAAIGYNGYALLTTRRDEWLVRFPVSFKSFGDYKAPLAIYLNGPFTWFLGSNASAVRVPFALSGVIAVGVWMAVVYRLWPEKNTLTRQTAALVAGSLLAISPWHIHYSRVAFESGLALSCILVGVWGLSWWQKRDSWHESSRIEKSWWWLVTFIGFGLSFYAYHSAKLVTPLLVVWLLILFQSDWKKTWKWAAGLCVAGLVLLRPLVLDTLNGQGGARFEQASLLAKGYSASEILRQLIANVWAHLQPGFLVFGQTPTLRHGDGAWGVLFVPTFLLVMLSILFGWRVSHNRRWWLLMVGWTVIGFFPALIGIDVPHSNRALSALPGLLGLAVLGLEIVLRFVGSHRMNEQKLGSHGEKGTLRRLFVGMVVAWYGLLFLSFLHHYFTVFAQQSAADFNDGYLEAFEYVVPYEKGTNGQEVDKVLFSNRYGQAYIYALLVRRTNPIWYQGGSLVKYEFTDVIRKSDLDRKNTVVVATPADGMPIEDANHVVYGSDGNPRFLIYVR